MKNHLPNFLKPIVRFIYYKNERKKISREPSIKKVQNKLLRKYLNLEIKKLIVFLVDGADWFTGKDKISGGILSIASIYEETQKLKHIHGADVIMVTQPKAHLLLKHSQFPNEISVFRFEQLKQFKNVDEVLIHIPEYQFKAILINAIGTVFNYVTKDKIHLNILNQRIDIMPKPHVINTAKHKGYTVTQTTAHQQYSNKTIREKFGIPLHKLSVYATPERYKFSTWKEKDNLILISPDVVAQKKDILEKLKIHKPDFTIKIISGITYMDYLNLIQRAKYMITFGEGLDFYFIETAFSGGISFAAYNEEFFTEEFKSVPGVFKSYEHMTDTIIDTIEALEHNIDDYVTVNKKQFDACHNIYNANYYKENLVNFYNKNYLFP
jgi:hypothetical protein